MRLLRNNHEKTLGLFRNNTNQSIGFEDYRPADPEDQVRQLTDRIEAERRLEEDDNFNKHIK